MLHIAQAWDGICVLRLRFPVGGPIILRSELIGISSSNFTNFLFDTGATRSIISQKIVDLIGPHPSLDKDRFQITTASGNVTVPEVSLVQCRIKEFVIDHPKFLAHNFPESAGVDGLLGWDFFSATKLNIDFESGVFEWVQA